MHAEVWTVLENIWKFDHLTISDPIREQFWVGPTIHYHQVNVVTFTNRGCIIGMAKLYPYQGELTTCWAIGMQWQPCIHRKDNLVLLAIHHCRLNTPVWPQWEGTIQQLECTCNIQGLIQFENACFISSSLTTGRYNLHIFWRWLKDWSYLV